MNISELSLKRPVLATVMNLMIILFGIVGFTFLAVRDYPAIDPPIITISTSYTGANPDIIESQITEPLEKQVNGIPGIRTITSSSSLGSSQTCGTKSGRPPGVCRWISMPRPLCLRQMPTVILS